MKNVAVIGAGAMGLATAYYLLKKGHNVTLFESDTQAGGMAAHFDFDGIDIERFYHFLCKSDKSLFELLQELEIAPLVTWRETSMGYFIDDKLYKWGDPLSLLRFPLLSLTEKIRYGLHMFLSTKRSGWVNLDQQYAKDWITKWAGKKNYDLLWRRLFELKLFEYTDKVSAAWIWTRIKRVGTSRRSIFKEELGYIQGGSRVFVEGIVNKIKNMGGTIHLDSEITQITIENNKVRGVIANKNEHLFDCVISTIPTPLISKLIPSLPEALKQKYDAIKNIGVVCVVAKLNKPVTSHFWVNINDREMDIPGIVEYSNLRSLPKNIVYVPYYMPQSHPKFQLPNDYFKQEVSKYLKRLNKSIADSDIEAIQVHRLKYAQPICTPGFLETIPDTVTPIDGLQIADTAYYYPEDRGLSESIRFGKMLASMVY